MLLFFVNSEVGRQNIKASLFQGRERESERERKRVATSFSGMYDITMALAVRGEHRASRRVPLEVMFEKGFAFLLKAQDKQLSLVASVA